MTRSTCGVLVLIGAVLAAGCGRQDPTAMKDEPAGRPDARKTAGEKEAIDALKELGANVALDEEGRAKVLRLTGPEITDAELEHVAKLTELRDLYLEATKVTEAGLAQLEPLSKLEKLHCVAPSMPGLRAASALKSPTEMEFIDCPLVDVLDTLADYHAIRFEIDEEALEAAGCPTDAPITAKHKAVALGEALAAIFEPLGLVWTNDEGVLVVTTEDALDEKWPNLARLREAVPSLTDVTVDFASDAEPAGQP
jgi:hypothetical protein